MNSYQKLKHKCDYLQRQVDIFKGALTVARKVEPQVYDPMVDSADSFMINLIETYNVSFNKTLNETMAYELSKWVAFNLDKESVLRLLEIKEKMENE